MKGRIMGDIILPLMILPDGTPSARLRIAEVRVQLFIEPRHRRIKVQPALLHAVQHGVAGAQLGGGQGFVAFRLGELGELGVGDREVALPADQCSAGLQPAPTPQDGTLAFRPDTWSRAQTHDYFPAFARSRSRKPESCGETCSPRAFMPESVS